MAENPTSSDPLAAFRIKRCLKCDYDFTGLPLGNTCPECGEAYSRDMLLLLGWSHAGYAASIWLWCLLGFIFVGVISPSLSAAITGPIWLACLAVVAWFGWKQLRHAKAGGNQRLLVTEKEVHRLSRRGRVLLRALDLRNLEKPPPKLGEALRRVRLKKRWGDTCELLLDAGFWRSFFRADFVRIALRCSESEAQALEVELRTRIARAIKGEEHK